jgi:replicative DNA helicase
MIQPTVSSCVAAPSGEPDAETEVALVPPHDLDTEGTVLSHCLVHGCLLPPLQPKHFYSDANGYIYAAMQLLAQRGEPIDLLAVARELRAQNRLKQVGGSGYLATIHNTQPATAYPERDAAVVRELYRRRALADAALRLRVELMTTELGADDAWERFKAICREIGE